MTWTRGTRAGSRALVVGGLLLGTLVGCSSSASKSSGSGAGSSPSPSATSAVCADVSSLQASVQALKDVPMGQGGLATLRTDVDQVKTELETLKTDAKSQYASEVTKLKTAVDASSADLDAAKANPSASTLAALAGSVRDVGVAAKELQSAVASTC